MIEIEKGVPLPERRAKRNEAKEILHRMVAGDSVLVSYKTMYSIYSAARRRGIKVTTRRMDHDKYGRYRLWRLPND